jgi:hypothetical protein
MITNSCNNNNNKKKEIFEDKRIEILRKKNLKERRKGKNG